MKMKSFKEMTAEELDRQIEDLRKEKFLLRAALKGGRNENPTKLRTARRDLARALTEVKLRSIKDA